MALGVPMAVGDPSPAWPLDHAPRKVTGDFGKARTGSASSSRPGAPRYHVAEDLPAPRGTTVLAPEAGTIVVARDRFYEGSGVVILQGDSGLVVALGEIEPGSYRAFGVDVGARVSKGQPVATVGRHHMLHLETYRSGTRTTSQWWKGDPPPPSLLDPTDYLRAAAGAPARPSLPPSSPTPTDPEPLPVTEHPRPGTFWKPPPPRDEGGGALVAGLLLLALAASGDHA